MEKYENMVRIQGRVISKKGGKNIESVIVETVKSPKGVPNILRVIGFGDVALRARKHIKKNAYVTFMAHLEPFKKKIGDREITVQDIVMDDFSFAEPKLTGELASEDGTATYDVIDEVTLAGVVSGLSKKGAVTHIALNVAYNGTMYTLMARSYDGKNDGFVSTIRPGDNLAIMGQIQSSRKTEDNGSIAYLEHFVGTDFSRIKK